MRTTTDPLPRPCPPSLGYTWAPTMAEENKGPTDEELRAAAHSVPWHYATGVRLRTNAYDVSMVFTRSVPPMAGAKEIEEPVCIVSMSPVLMMSMLRLFERHVRIYEKNHGVKLPDILKFEDPK